jgi:hypothetical protein
MQSKCDMIERERTHELPPSFVCWCAVCYHNVFTCVYFFLSSFGVSHMNLLSQGKEKQVCTLLWNSSNDLRKKSKREL